MKSKVLFVLHMPPPVHGASWVGKQIHESEAVHEAFDCRFINLSTSEELAAIGRFGWRKVVAVRHLLRQIGKAPYADLAYVTPSATPPGFLKDYLVVRLLKRRGMKVVLHFHNKGVATHSENPVFRFLYRRFFKDTRVILLSWTLYPDVAVYVPRESVSICPNGIEPGPAGRPGGPDAEPRILFLSNLIRTKGVDVLLEACRILKERGCRFQCSLVGAASADYPAGTLASAISERDLDGLVTWSGGKYGADKQAELQAADIFVFPTFYPKECFPLVILEAMSAGLPVVSTPEGAIPDLVQDGVTGLLCKKKDPVSLADALQRLLSDPELRRRMGAAGRSAVLESYTSRQFETNLIHILYDAL
ncbi:MAG: glycosyltransferase family 4 protein [Bacteroidales bacterium]|nr:glycosyltransferase family 4 protein [Bacteroidales bacterium]